MTTQTNHNVSMPTAKLAAVEIAVVVGVGVLVGLAMLPVGQDAAMATIGGVAAVLFGVALGLMPFWLMGPRPAQQWAMPVLFAGGVRMMGSLGAAVYIWMTFTPDKVGFWTCFLVAGIAALIAEVRVALPVVASGASSTSHGSDGQTEMADVSAAKAVSG